MTKKNECSNSDSRTKYEHEQCSLYRLSFSNCIYCKVLIQYSSILFDFKAFTSGSVVPLAMFKDVVQIFSILKRKANVNNDDNDNVSECDDNDKKAKKVITSRKWI